MGKAKLLMDADVLKKSINEQASKILEVIKEKEKIAIIGIRTRGVPLASRLKEILDKKTGLNIPIGKLDITLYRDDLSTIDTQPIVGITDLPFDVTDKIIILVDDVIFTGRTIRAALDAIIDFGRPKSIKAFILIDRGLREYPIQPDFYSLKVETNYNQVVQVRLKEVDGSEEVLLVDLKKD